MDVLKIPMLFTEKDMISMQAGEAETGQSTQHSTTPEFYLIHHSRKCFNLQVERMTAQKRPN
jgi:hypothetical protein